MRFIGQKHIMKQLQFLLPNLFKNGDRGANILIKGPSGYGKTTMALSICQYLAGNSFHVYNAEFNGIPVFHKRVVFIDEVHKVMDHEKFYYLMDSKKHILVFATNKDGNLPEAFVNRCFEFIFTEYTDDELCLIALENVSFKISDAQLLEVVNAGVRNPRIIKSIIFRLNMYFEEFPAEINTSNSISTLIENTLSIINGMDSLSREYIGMLETCGGVASISLLARLLHSDIATLKNNVEPVLIKKGLIKITSKGRSLNNDSNEN